ncbi:class I SAM-dependent methyltransferase [Longimicrobium sp.]|uniref:class I SAM-dependent methyltransferase n=1 Tax=Longimicrobium sp. TaxID=2029185 RepID=UPI003B3B47E0
MNPNQCPVCQGTQLRRLFSRGSWTYRACADCGHRFAALPEREADALDELYQDEYAGFREDAVFQAAIRERLRTEFAPRVPAGGRILDVGCGNGEFMAAAKEAGYQVVGTDISVPAVELCRSRGLDAVAGDFLTLPFEGTFDAVTMWDVIEHLTDPVAFVARARSLLRPGGYLVVKTPGVTDRMLTMVKVVPSMASSILHEDHIQFFTAASFSRLAQRAGFDGVEALRLGDMRGKRPVRSFRRRLSRSARQAVNGLGGHFNHYVWMRAPGAAAAPRPA